MSSDNERPKAGQSVLEPGARPRRSTLETFNEELAVLDRPLEGDVEYYDELPPKRRLRRLPVAVAVFAVAGGGLLALSGHHAGALPLARPVPAVARARAPIEATAAAVSTPAPSAPAIAPIGTPAVPIATATTATAPTETPTESPAQRDEAPPPASSPAPRAAWAKNLHLAGQHSKHHHSAGSRSSGRSARRRG